MSMKPGIDANDLNPSIRPQDDLFRHVNGKWFDSVAIPEDKAIYGAFAMLADDSEAAVREVLEEAAANPLPGVSQQIGDLYASFMDEERANELGAAPIAADLKLIEQVRQIDDATKLLGEYENLGLSGLFGIWVDNDEGNPDRYIVNLAQGGLGLPDEAYYREEQFAQIRAAFLVHVEKMCGLVGIKDGAQVAKQILALETQIATHHWDQVKDRDATLTYNKYSRAELETLAPHFLFDTWAENAKVPGKAFETLVVCEPSFFENVSAMLGDFAAQRDSWVAWLKLNLVSASAAYLTDDIVLQNFDFYAKTLSGTPEIRVRWKRAITFVEGALGEAIGQIYVQRHFPQAAKVAMLELVDNLIEAYRISINPVQGTRRDTSSDKADKNPLSQEQMRLYSPPQRRRPHRRPPQASATPAGRLASCPNSWRSRRPGRR